MAVTGAELRRIRRRLGFSQRELAERLGLHPNTVARQERGEIPITAPVAKLVRFVAESGERGSRRRRER